ncbi:MAG: MGMT family protein [Candidatus Thorarchaeota archaeon]|nr:MGMT family protein [Candidatus Thorarchaeota archaeon]
MPDGSSKTLTVLEVNGLYAAAVMTTTGIFATSLPRPSRSEAVQAVRGESLPETTDPEALKVLRLVFQVFEGRPVDLSGLRFDFTGLSAKQRKVLETTMQIPYGTTITYGELARNAGLQGAARFVGNVMAANRFAPLIPCHRVISGTGLGGYGLGLHVKTTLLKREGALQT